MVKAVFDELGQATAPKNHFTVGIVDDVTHTVAALRRRASTSRPTDVVARASSTAWARTARWAPTRTRSRSSARRPTTTPRATSSTTPRSPGAITVSHLRFGPRPDPLAYLIDQASFVACHQFEFLERIDVLEHAAPGAVFLLNAPYGPDEVWDHLPREVQEQIIEKRLRFFVIDADAWPREAGMGGRINTIMQTCFFASPASCPREEAIAQIKKAIEKTYGKRGPEVVRRNFAAVDAAAGPPARGAGARRRRAPRARGRRWSPSEAPDFVQKVTAVMLAGKGDLLPVSAFPVDGTWPDRHRAVGEAQHRRSRSRSGTRRSASSATSARWSARTPPSAPRSTTERRSPARPATFKADGLPRARVQGQEVHDPGGARGLHRLQPVRRGLPGQGPDEPQAQGDQHGAAGAAARGGAGQLRLLPRPARARPRAEVARLDDKGSQFLRAAVRVLRRLRRLRRDALPQAAHPALRRPAADRQRHRLLVDLRRQPAHHALHHQPRRAAARPGRTRSSRTTPSSASASGSRSTPTRPQARGLLERAGADSSATALAAELLEADQTSEAGIAAQRERVAALQATARGARRARGAAARDAGRLPGRRRASGSWAATAGPTTSASAASTTCWPAGRDVNVLVLDTEVYSNTGGQQSKATPLGAAAKFAAGGQGGRARRTWACWP